MSKQKSLYDQIANIYIFAGALTYYTVLSVVPILAVAFGIALLFDLQVELKKLIIENFVDTPEVAEYFINFAYSLLERARGGLIAAVGSFALLWTIFSLLTTLEYACNEIWDIHKGRSWKKQIAHYVALMFIGPLLLVLATFALLYVTATFTLFQSLITLATAPLLIASLMFFVFWYMPHTKVPFLAALFSALVASTVYESIHWIYVKFQLGISYYGAIYGSFAAIPLFLIWVQISWVILLSGVYLTKRITD